MKSTRMSLLFLAVTFSGMACTSKSGDSGGAGGSPGSGGVSSSGGATARGGSGGGESSKGGAGSGGAQATGGTQGAGGMSDTGGATGNGGKPGSGGVGTTGGALGQGGKTGSGGAENTGGTQGKGGAVGSGGASVADAGTTDAQSSTELHARKIVTRGFTFDALEAGPATGEPVLLLHGFPEISAEWTALMKVLAANGYHCLAPDQRGYSPGARPTEVDAYKYAELVADGFAFGSELGEKFHVVAHDWGANIAWLMLQKDPSPIASFTTIAVPHYQVWATAVYNDPDMKQYLSMLTTWNTPEKGEAYWTESAMRTMFKNQAKKPSDLIDLTVTHMLEPGCMTAALNWYRASNAQKSVIDDFQPWKVSVPTLLIFGTTDIGQKTVTDTKPLMTGPFRVVQPTGGHFMVDEQPKVVADETLAQLKAYPIK